ncbi:MAG: ABC transporter transmembrane domain-containing protein [Pseudomonadota bacterium]
MSKVIVAIRARRGGPLPHTHPAARSISKPTEAQPTPGLMALILSHAPGRQAVLAALALSGAPLLYVTLELPKIIVDGALDGAAGGALPPLLAGLTIECALAILCAAQLVAVLSLSALKYAANVLSADLGEWLLLRLRQQVIRRWRHRPAAERNGALAPVLGHELEAIAGFAGSAVSTPISQGLAWITVMAFLLVQDWRLALAAFALTPLQVLVAPVLLTRLNALKRERIHTVRDMCADLTADEARIGGALRGARHAKRLRHAIHRRKFLMKALYNGIGHMVPLSYLAIGGGLVITGELSLGALVAALAAYREGAGPMRELFSHYLRWADARTRYTAVAPILAEPVSNLAEGVAPQSHRPLNEAA